MKILMTASESVPEVKSGGLADVIGSLPAAMARRGHAVKLFIPHYSSIDLKANGFTRATERFDINLAGKLISVEVTTRTDSKLPLEICLIKVDDLFDRNGMYIDPSSGKDYKDNDLRFGYFCRAVLEFTKRRRWQPDVIHSHDWQAALVNVYCRTVYKNDPFLRDIPTLFTIHNLAYQGTFPPDNFARLGFSESLFYPASPFEFYGKLNFLKAALFYSDKISTVSETYAREIQSTSEFGCGLEGVLRERTDDLTGILNGVDYTIWSPSKDNLIDHKFYRDNLGGKRYNKVELLNYASLPVRDNTPLVGMVSRLVDQKGFDLIAEVADDIFAMNLQMVLLGTGDRKYHELFESLQRKYPEKLKIFLTFDNRLAHRIEAGCDLFLMPSRYEPCGLNQLYSLKYGTVPVVRRVGGLADTVEDYDANSGQGTGFVFDKYDSASMLEALQRAMTTFKQRRVWTKIMKAGMSRDFSWDESASKYESLYRELVKGKSREKISGTVS